jgi:hypothetical protein
VKVRDKEFQMNEQRSGETSIRWPVGSSVRIGAGAGEPATFVEVIPTYRVQLDDGGWMVVEERQIKPDNGQRSA